jgi:hypothetical protein
MSTFPSKWLISLVVVSLIPFVDLIGVKKGDQSPKMEVSPSGFRLVPTRYTIRVVIPSASPDLYCPTIRVKVVDGRGDIPYKHEELSDCPPWTEEMRGKRLSFSHTLFNLLGEGNWTLVAEVEQNGKWWRLTKNIRIGGMINDE